MKTKIVTTGVIISVALISSCNKEEGLLGARVPVLPETTIPYDEIPGIVDFDPMEGFVIDNEKATLGRVLFYDTQLSINNRISCATCHKQAFGFADNVAQSVGFENKLTPRNSPAILNAGLQEAFFHDLREEVLENMVLKPIGNHIEMGLEDQQYLLNKVGSLNYYKPLFENAFGSDSVTLEKISAGMVHFIRSMVSINSKYDIGTMTGFSNFTEEELLGKDLYFAKFPCSGCHGGDNLNGGSSAAENIGLDSWYSDQGMTGIEPVSGNERNGWFKVPSLRNIAQTAPYMHDGRFQTLEEVVEFYNSGMSNHPQLSFMLRKNTNGGFFFFGEDPMDEELNAATGIIPLRMHMTNEEKKALVAFMKTFTDETFLTNERFSDPFRVVEN
jgi:cytochrome c peroxidase